MPALVSPLKRAALFVTDLARMRAFYERALGLRVFYEGLFEGGPAAALLGLPPDTTVPAVLLRADETPYGWLGLFAVPGAPLAPRAGAVAGEACLVFDAPALDPVWDSALAAGARAVAPPVLLAVPGATTQREATFRDPEGFLVNIIERAEPGGTLRPIAPAS